jgi:hypothetical protein
MSGVFLGLSREGQDEWHEPTRHRVSRLPRSQGIQADLALQVNVRMPDLGHDPHEKHEKAVEQLTEDMAISGPTLRYEFEPCHEESLSVSQKDSYRQIPCKDRPIDHHRRMSQLCMQQARYSSGMEK